MTAETWILILIIALGFLGIVDIIGLMMVVKLYRENKWARNKIHKLITGDNVDMSIETLSLYYHISEERIDQLLTMEKEYIDDGK